MLSSKLGLGDLSGEIKGKRVLIRVDFNVPMKDGVVTDPKRITATVPTIKSVLENGAKAVILMSHCGRPDGRHQQKYTLQPCVTVLQKALGRDVTFISECIGPVAEAATKDPAPGSVILLENLRFHLAEEGKGKNENGDTVKAEKADVESFRAALTRHGDVFVNDAFGTAHRAHSSMVGIDLPMKCAGLLMKKELDYFGKVLESPPRPFLAILGGAKVNDKIQLIKSMFDRVDIMIIGGGMAFTFKKLLDGMPIGSSLFDSEAESIVKEIRDLAKEKNVKLVFPSDFLIADKFQNDACTKIVDEKEGIPDGWMGVDCGPKSIEAAKEAINSAKLILWNGPPGVFEMSNFATGSLAFIEAVASATKAGAISVVGGGDTASLVEMGGRANEMSHVSTGGGASLELLEGKELPGVGALSDKK